MKPSEGPPTEQHLPGQCIELPKVSAADVLAPVVVLLVVIIGILLFKLRRRA